MAKHVQFESACPPSEYDTAFLKGMVDRMGASFYKYGPLAEADTKIVNPIANLKLRLAKYEATGNADWLMDVANFAMIEHMKPSHPKAHFRATDSRESPGRIWTGEVDPTPANNRGEV